jgi:hypothetical protein
VSSQTEQCVHMYEYWLDSWASGLYPTKVSFSQSLTTQPFLHALLKFIDNMLHRNGYFCLFSAPECKDWLCFILGLFWIRSWLTRNNFLKVFPYCVSESIDSFHWMVLHGNIFLLFSISIWWTSGLIVIEKHGTGILTLPCFPFCEDNNFRILGKWSKKDEPEIIPS